MDDGDDLSCIYKCEKECDHVDARVKSRPKYCASEILHGDTFSEQHPNRSSLIIPSSSNDINMDTMNENVPFNFSSKQATRHISQGHVKRSIPKFCEESVEEKNFRYSCKGALPGFCLVVNVEHFEPHLKFPDRIGAMKDKENIQRSFSKLQFKCFLLSDPSVIEMKETFKELASHDHSNSDCFASVILTHGEDNGIIYARDGKLKLDDLIDPFRGNACPTLVGKPKLFFVQACRGSKLDHGVLMTDGGSLDDTDGAQPLHRIPTEADFLLAFSVIPGYFSWRNSTKGSWFIQALAEMLDRYGSSLDLLTILTRVSHKVAYNFESNAATEDWSHKKQIPCIVSMLTKDLYFSPKS